MDKKVSVIIPTYNRKNLVKEAINSVLNQVYKNFEIIVVDDDSEDGTKEIEEEFEGKIRYFYIKNGGVSKARNYGILKSTGEYITFLDSDDLWQKDKLKKQIDLLFKNPEYKICYTDEIWYRNGIRVNQQKKHYKPSGDIFLDALSLCRISASSIMVEREVFNDIGMFDESLPVCEDYDLWLRMSLKYPIYLINEPLIIKRNGLGENLSQKYWGMDRFRVKSLEKILSNNNLKKEYRRSTLKELIFKLKILSNGSLKRGKLIHFFCYMLKYFGHYFGYSLGKNQHE